MMSKSEDLAKILNVFSLFSSPTAPWACCEVIPQMQKCQGCALMRGTIVCCEELAFS